MYDQHGEHYHAKRQNGQKSLWNEYLDIPAMTELLKQHIDGCDVLDLGCGSGIFTTKVKT